MKTLHVIYDDNGDISNEELLITFDNEDMSLMHAVASFKGDEAKELWEKLNS